MRLHPLANDLYRQIKDFTSQELLFALELGLIHGDFICLHDNVSGTFYARGGEANWHYGPELAHFNVADGIYFRSEGNGYVRREYVHED